MKLINNNFYVVGSNNEIHELDKNLNCSCKGFFVHGHCKHQQEAEDYVMSGELVDLARRPMRKTESGDFACYHPHH